MTITAVLPTATTTAATLVSATGATLHATVNPKGSATTVQFQYIASTGTTTTTTPTVNLNAGTANALVTAPISGLLPGTLYHFHVLAGNSAGGPVSGAALAFTTLLEPMFNPPSPALQPPPPQLSASGVIVGSVINPQGVATTVHFAYGTDMNNLNLLTGTISVGAGKVPVIASAFLGGLQRNTTYYYQLVSVSAAGTFYGPVEMFTTLNFDTTLVAATTGTLAPETNVTWATLGSAAVNGADGAAFRATLTGVAAASNTGIWANVANNDALSLVAQIGSSAPGNTGAPSGAVFSALTDPVYNNGGDVAFGGTLKVATGIVTAATEYGVWSSNSGTLSLLAREGSVAPGTSGALFATFTGAGISDSGAIVVGTLTASKALNVTATNNAGVWEGSTPSNLTLMLRTGESTTGTVTPKTISSFKLFRWRRT